MVRIRRELARGEKRVVFTNGCFDLLHLGHVRYLQQAKELGDVLVIGVNSDASTARIKGPPRPIIPQADRGEILSALAAVDYVVIFDEDTAENLVMALKPDVYIKGGDYARGNSKAKAWPEADVVIKYGGLVVVLPFLPGRSTSNIIEKIAGLAKE
ncbi:MAG: D-glycero-beta-D-manno-heptose 1-phosphate adenylyltransferase [Chloroflexi bacterium]|nr:D-glycero-beta-D-manno-heptose 1-phosphate adenylyltransferase [Chloroflexota bacterium]